MKSLYILHTCLFTLSCSAAVAPYAGWVGEKEFWISSQPVVGTNADGSLFAPYRATNWMTLSNLFGRESRPNITWHLLDGTFYSGNPGIPPKVGWKIRGAGISNTIVMMSSNAAFGIGTGVFMSSNRTDYAEISDMTVDCNLAGQISPDHMDGVRMIGSFTKVSRVLVINMGGISNECFAVAIGNDQVNTNYYPVIEDCIGTQPANIDGITNNGITMFSIHADGPSKSGLVRGGTIRGCMVYNIVSAAMTTGSPLFIHAFSDGTGGMTVNNFAYNLTGAGSYGIYNDTWDGRDSVIMGNVMDNVFRCVMFNMDSYHRTGVVLANNILRPAQNGIGVYYYRGAGTDTNSYAKWFGMQGNIIYPAEGAVDVTPVSIDTTNIPTLVANILQGQGTQPDFEFFQPSNTVANANFTNAIPP